MQNHGCTENIKPGSIRFVYPFHLQPSTVRTRPHTLHNKTSFCGQAIGSFRVLTQQITFRTRPLVIHIW